MTKQTISSLVAAATLGLIGVTLAGCHGGASKAATTQGIIAQMPNTPQTQAKLQSQLNNPRVSPRMKQALQMHLQQSQGAGQHQ